MLLKLALGDLWHDRLLSLCAVLAMAAVVAPLLLLFSLREGIVSELKQNLLNNPANLEIRMITGGNLDDEFIQSIRDDPHTLFVLPMIRSIAASVDLTRKDESGKRLSKSAVETLITAPGDPLLLKAGLLDYLSNDELYVTQTLADSLKLKAGDSLSLIIRRNIGLSAKDAFSKQEAQSEYSRRDFKVMGILPAFLLSREALFINQEVMESIEDYRDGFEPLIFSDGSKLKLTERIYARLRLYAKTIDDVRPLSQRLRQSFNIVDKSAEIENTKSIERVLDFIFYVIALASVAGGALALSGLIAGSLVRKERSFALLRLMGLPPFALTLMVCLEALLLSLLAYGLAYLIFASGQTVFNTHFAALLNQGVFVSQMPADKLLTGALICCLIATLVALLCVLWRLLPKEIAGILREGV